MGPHSACPPGLRAAPATAQRPSGPLNGNEIPRARPNSFLYFTLVMRLPMRSLS